MDGLDLWTAKALMALRLERQPPWIGVEALLHRVEATGQRRWLGRSFRLVGKIGCRLVALGRRLERYSLFRSSVPAGR